MANLIIDSMYKVTKEIKIHTKPVRKVRVEQKGAFKKETNMLYIFDTFSVRKDNVVKIKEVECI